MTDYKGKKDTDLATLSVSHVADLFHCGYILSDSGAALYVYIPYKTAATHLRTNTDCFMHMHMQMHSCKIRVFCVDLMFQIFGHIVQIVVY